jgi:hypothetical protein
LEVTKKLKRCEYNSWFLSNVFHLTNLAFTTIWDPIFQTKSLTF